MIRKTGFWWLSGWLVVGAPAICHATVVVNGTLTSQAGNNGNPAVQVTVAAPTFGAYAVGPVSGPQFGNNSTQGALVLGAQPSPSLSASAIGSDSGQFAANGGTTFIQASIVFDFSVLGPATGIGVPLLFGGSTDGQVSNTGDPNRWNSVVGTRLEITSVGGVFNFAAAGPQSGTPADLFSSSVQDVRAAWGQMASAPVNYSSYSAAFQYGATVRSGAFASGTQVVKLATILQGGTRGVGSASGLPSSGSANTFLNATVQIDPDWHKLNPEYTLVVDSVFGVSPVPEPHASWLVLAGLAGLAGALRLRQPAA